MIVNKFILLVFICGFCWAAMAAGPEDAPIAHLKCVDGSGKIFLESYFLLNSHKIADGIVVEGRPVFFQKSNIRLPDPGGSEAREAVQKNCKNRTVKFSTEGPEKILVCGPGSELNLEPTLMLRMIPTGKWYYENYKIRPKIGVFSSCNDFAELR